ncbi:uncharacterized protein [Ambystoma mexicanum]|uniref:uncharacterized protein isoform X2 n=2 Tax=Ambystoma mexicanum TaxID=8296 RepID=UPI0037E86FC5
MKLQQLLTNQGINDFSSPNPEESILMKHKVLFKDENQRKGISLLLINGSFISGKPWKPLPTPMQHSETKIQTGNLEEEEDDVDSKDFDDLPSMQKWQCTIRKRAAEAGIFNKHPLDCDLLIGFQSYLKEDMGVKNCKQEVENVSRFLIFCVPSKATFNFVTNLPCARAFFNLHRDTGLSQQTFINYMKNIKRLEHYHIVAADLKEIDGHTFNSAQHFKYLIEDMQKKVSKGVSKEVTQRRYKEFREYKKTPGDCITILDKAKDDLLGVMEPISSNMDLTYQEQILVLYYLEPILLLSHLQRPGVVSVCFMFKKMMQQEGKGSKSSKFVNVMLYSHLESQ